MGFHLFPQLIVLHFGQRVFQLIDARIDLLDIEPHVLHGLDQMMDGWREFHALLRRHRHL